MLKLGIIPAAGKAERFGGIAKELLPSRNGSPLIVETLLRMIDFQIDTHIVVTTAAKCCGHVAHSLDDTLFLRQNNAGLSGAVFDVMSAFRFCKANYLLMMPDTDYSSTEIPDLGRKLDKVQLGIFTTRKPERFGVLKDGRIFDKDKTLSGKQKAWGWVAWHSDWISSGLELDMLLTKPFDHVLNYLIENHGYETYKIM